ncbi:hypothetical protein [Pseudorhizobium marinum]|uniref:hypothetical protein n=1 Tax=Pseudorhizobium marinum TaxID=1496690 RepID=UPI00049607C6|nr:hypothetical protein [Pseudorhizobium marinum]
MAQDRQDRGLRRMARTFAMFLRSILKTRWGYAYAIGLLLIGMTSSPDEGLQNQMFGGTGRKAE